MYINRYITIMLLLVSFGTLSGCASTDNRQRSDNLGSSDSKKSSASGAEAVAEEEGPTVGQKPSVSEFILGVGDSIDITIYRNDDLKTSVKINPSGKITMPLIGDVDIAGKSVFALRDELRDRYSRYLVDPQVMINVTLLQGSKVLVLGEVRNPGVYSLDTDLTVMDAVAKAGGWTTDARTGSVVLIRNESGKSEVTAFDAGAVLDGNVSSSGNGSLHRNDIVYVPSKTIVDIARFMSNIGTIMSPIVNIESGIVLWPQVENVLNGKTSASTTQLTIPAK